MAFPHIPQAAASPLTRRVQAESWERRTDALRTLRRVVGAGGGGGGPAPLRIKAHGPCLSCRHTLRFWNAAFFDAVHCERRKRSPTTR